MIHMNYDVQSTGVKISLLVCDGEATVPEGSGGFEGRVDAEAKGECDYPQSPYNLRLLAKMMIAMADEVEAEDGRTYCKRCGRRITHDAMYWTHLDGDNQHLAIPQEKRPYR